MNMYQVGDGPEGQPTEGVDALEDLANSLDPVEDQTDQRDAQDESGDEDENEQVEAEEGEDEDEEEAEEDPTVVIKHDGKEVELKLSEVKDLAQQGFDYSKKTMAVAEERKAVEAIRSQADEYRREAEQARAQQLTQLQALEQFYEQQLGEPPPLEWAQQDAGYFIAQKEQYEARKGKLEQARKAIGYLQEEQARSRQAWIVQQANETEAALRDTLPGWSEATLPTLAEYAKSLGLTPQSAELAFVHKGFWEALHKAKAYDQIQADKAKLKPKSELKKVQKPGVVAPTGKAAERAKREAAFNKNPSVDALAELLR